MKPITTRAMLLALLSSAFLFAGCVFASPPPMPAPKAAKPAGNDRLTFENGDSLRGTLEREVEGTVYFHSDELGDLSIPWKKIRSLTTGSSYAVLRQRPGVHVRHHKADALQGALAMSDGTLHIHTDTDTAAAASPSLPVKEAQFILDEKTFRRQLVAEPNLFQGWNGSATLGATLVRGTESQYTYTSAVALERSVPTVSWLATRNRMQLDFSSSYGRITQPAYVDSGMLIPASYTKSAIFHADAERDEYVSTRVYALAQTAFDHNYSQGLDLQEIYGAGFGVTAIKRSTQQLDLKGNLQYEKQSFITTTAGTNQDLIGSTFSGTYSLKLHDHLVFDQQLEYLPAYNVLRAYSANETNTLTIPFYKQISFTIGTIDSYLNDPVAAAPPTKRNSLQFTTGLTYTLKSKY